MEHINECPKCKELGLKSEIVITDTGSTLMGVSKYVDDNAIYHSHNGNRKTDIYKCSNNHRFETIYYEPCPNCNFNRHEKETINILN